MKKQVKKLLALVMAMTIAVIPTTAAFAEDLSSLDQTVVEQDATVNYLDPTSVVRITVPTSTSLAFTLDPQNLATTQGVGDWNPENGGSIIPSAVGIVVNKSAFHVKTSVDFTLVDTAETKVTLVDNETGINEGIDKNMYFTLTPASGKVTIDAAEIEELSDYKFLSDDEAVPVEFEYADLITAGYTDGTDMFDDAVGIVEGEGFGKFIKTADAESTIYNQIEVEKHGAIDATKATTVSEFNATEEGLAANDLAVTISENGASLAYVINPADHYVKKTGEVYSLVLRNEDTNANYDTASFIIGGKINKNADWSGYAGETKITMSATYTFEALDAKGVEDNTKLEGSYNSVEATAPTVPTAPSIETTTYTLTADTALNVTVNLGTGDKAATGISKITYLNSTNQTKDLDITNYTFEGNTLTLKAEYLNTVIPALNPSRDYTIIFNNNPSTSISITVSK